MGRILSPIKNQPENDLVYTPRCLSKNIIEHFNPTGILLDPCKGDGSFYDQFPLNCEKYWCEIQDNIDFFNFNRKVDWIITNPPWSKIRQFILHGMSISDNIVYLAILNHFLTKARLRDLRINNFCIKEIYGVKTPLKPWPSSGFQLAAVHLVKSSNFIPITLSGEFG